MKLLASPADLQPPKPHIPTSSAADPRRKPSSKTTPASRSSSKPLRRAMFTNKAFDVADGHLAPGGRAGDSRRASTCSSASSTGARRTSVPLPSGSEDTPLNVTDALVGLIAASAQAQSDIEELNTAPGGRTASLGRLYDEVKGFKTTVLLAHKVLGRRTASADRARHVKLDTLIAAFGAAILTVSEMENRIEQIVRQSDQLEVTTEEICERFSRSLAKDANRISMLEFTLSKLISVLHISDLRQGIVHSRQAGVLVEDILQADATLLARMQTLSDAYGGLDLVPAARLAERDNRPPPGYTSPSPPAGQACAELPNYTQAMQADDDALVVKTQDWSVYSHLNLADIPDLSRITLPLILGEIKDGTFYTRQYVESVDAALRELEGKDAKHRLRELPRILGISEPEAEAETSQKQGRVGLMKRMAQKYGSRNNRE